MHADSIWSCWWLMVGSMSDSPLCSDLSYFLGELEKCVAEPERLAQLFIKHVSLSIILAFICLSVSSKVEQNFILHWVNRAEKTQGFLTRTPVLTPHLFSHHPTLFLSPLRHRYWYGPFEAVCLLVLCPLAHNHKGKRGGKSKRRSNKDSYVL